MRLRLAVLILCLLGGPLLAEGVMRFLLFHPSALARAWGAGVRDPGLFAVDRYEDEYWRLEWLLREDPDKDRHPPYDELLGWTNPQVAPSSYDYLPAFELAGRRPVVMYGASFADCVTGPEDCWQDLLEQSPLGERYALMNYGVGGHGCGQTLTLMRATLDRFTSLDPIVVVALVADSDFTRVSLGFRSWPKLELKRRGSELAPSGPVAPGGSRAFLAAQGTGITSYCWRYLLHAPGVLPEAWQRSLRGARARQDEQDQLMRDVVLAMRDELEGRQLEYFFLLFTSPRGLPPARIPREERLLMDLFGEARIPVASARHYLRRAAGDLEHGLESLFIRAGPQRNHPSIAGNRVVFEALADGIEGRLPQAPSTSVADVRSEDRVDERSDDRRGLQDHEHDGRGQQQDEHRSEPPVGAAPEGND